ncbi:MAG: hypothetical protein AAGA84_09970 [Pseudomonadota bacterium]
MSLQFLELALSSDDVLADLRGYEALGFTELTVTDAWSHGYAAMTDGQIVIGLHARDASIPTPIFVSPDVAGTALKLADTQQLQILNIDEDHFHHVRMEDRDGFALMYVEARTFSPSNEHASASLGTLFEWTLPVRDAIAAAQFWAPRSTHALAALDEPRAHLRFDIGGLPLALSEICAGRSPVLCYRVEDVATLGITLDQRGLALAPCRTGLPGCIGILEAPGGLTMAFFERDFS